MVVVLVSVINLITIIHYGLGYLFLLPYVKPITYNVDAQIIATILFYLYISFINQTKWKESKD